MTLLPFVAVCCHNCFSETGIPLMTKLCVQFSNNVSTVCPKVPRGSECIILQHTLKNKKELKSVLDVSYRLTALHVQPDFTALDQWMLILGLSMGLVLPCCVLKDTIALQV